MDVAGDGRDACIVCDCMASLIERLEGGWV